MSGDVLELLKTAPAPPMSIDPYAAMADARSAAVRRRTLIGGAIAAASAGGLAVVAFGQRDTTTSPAGTRAAATFTPEQVGIGGRVPVREVRVSGDASARSFTVQLIPTDPVLAATSTVISFARSAPGGFATTITPDHIPYLIAIGPRDASVLPVPLQPQGVGAWAVPTRQILGTDFSLTVQSLQSEAVDVVLWADPIDAHPIFSDGSTTATARLQLGDQAASFWINRQHRLINFAVGAGRSIGREPSMVGGGALPADPPYFSAVDSSWDPAPVTFMSPLLIGVLPAGATAIEPDLAAGVTGVIYATGLLSDGSAVVVMMLRTVDTQMSQRDILDGIQGLRWRDASGSSQLTARR